ncbi:MAG: ABC transporter substrate-binding protein [Pseudomonadota bacterium]
MTCRTMIRGRAGLAIGRRARNRIAGSLIGLLIGWAPPGLAANEASSDPARQLVDAAIQDSLQVVGAPQLSRSDATERLRTLLDRYVDLPRVGRETLGTYWRRASAEQQAGFLALFESFLAVGYSSSVAKLGAIRFGPTSVVERADDLTVIQSDVQLGDGGACPVLFLVGRSDDGSYRVVDVIAAAISMSKLLSADFGAVLRSNGGRFDALIDALQQKLATTVPVSAR